MMTDSKPLMSVAIPVWQTLSALNSFADHIAMPCSDKGPGIEMHVQNVDVFEGLQQSLRAVTLSQYYSTPAPSQEPSMGHDACRQEWTDRRQA